MIYVLDFFPRFNKKMIYFNKKKNINESCYMHFQGLLYGSRIKSLSC